MKKILLSIFLGLGLLTSCDMDKAPVGALDDQNALQSVNDFARFRNGIYNSIRSMNSGAYLYDSDIQSDQFIGLTTAGNRTGELNNGLLTPSSQDITPIYQAMYSRIQSVNYFLGVAEAAVATEGRFDEDQLVDMNRYIAEAKFARGYYYYWLMDRFCQDYTPDKADTPALGLQLVTKFEPTGDSSTYPGRSTFAETLKRINDDLTDAFNGLAAFEQVSNSALKPQSPYINTYIVRALQARIALATKDYPTAATKASEVINSGLYTLANLNNYIDMWTDNNNNEIIFKPFVDATESSAISSTAYGYISYQDDNTASYIPTMDVLFSYEWTITPEGAIEANDVRFDAFFKIWQLNFEGDLALGIVFFKYPGNAAIISGTDYRKTIPMPFRLSEQYLILAEASAATAGGETAANNALNTLRKNRIKGWTDQNYSGTALVNQIREERGKELIGEGFRLSDLRRWGLGFQRDGDYPLSPALEDFIVPLSLSCVYTANDYRYTWPIPTDEMEINPQLKGQQNPVYGD